MNLGQTAVSEKEIRVADHGLFEETRRLEKIFFHLEIEARPGAKNFGTHVEFVSLEIARRFLRDGGFFGGGKFRLQLIGNHLGDLALDGENVIERAIIAFGPNVCVGAGIDQLRAYPHAATGPLHTAFQNMRDPELLRDVTQIAPDAALVLLHRGAADHLEVGDFCEVGEDFIGHTLGEERIFFFVA